MPSSPPCAIYGEALSAEAVRGLYQSESNAYRIEPRAYFPENDLFRLKMAPGGGDEADIPGEVTLAPGVQLTVEGGRPVFAFDGTTSHVIVRDQPRERLLSKPYALILDFLPAPGAHGTLLRRHHANCLSLDANGTLTFDANIGRRNFVCFSKAVRFGAWNRIVLAYDGRKVSLEVNGVRLGQQAYEGMLYNPGGDFPLVFLADNTYPHFPQALNVQCKVRELRIVPLLDE